MTPGEICRALQARITEVDTAYPNRESPISGVNHADIVVRFRRPSGRERYALLTTPLPQTEAELDALVHEATSTIEVDFLRDSAGSAAHT